MRLDVKKWVHFGGTTVRKSKKFAVIAVLSGAMLFQLGGCGLDSFTRNVWRGFGYSIGGLPASFVTGFLTDLLASLGIGGTAA